jgi:hypothetical protein
MKRPTLTFFLLLTFFLFCISASAQVEQVIAYVVTDEATMIDALDTWFASKESRYNQTATLVSTVANGSDPPTHYRGVNYPSFASYQAAYEGVVQSGEFAKLERRISKIMTSSGDSLYSQVLSNGKSEKAGDYIYTISVNVTGSAIEYAAAMKELMNSEIGKKCRMMKLMSAAPATESSHLGSPFGPIFCSFERIPGFLYREQGLGQFPVKGCKNLHAHRNGIPQSREDMEITPAEHRDISSRQTII